MNDSSKQYQIKSERSATLFFRLIHSQAKVT